MGVVIQGWSFSLHCRRGETELPDTGVCLCQQETTQVSGGKTSILFTDCSLFLGSEGLVVSLGRFNKLGRLGQQLARHKEEAEIGSFSAQSPCFSSACSRVLQHSLCLNTRSICFLPSTPSLLERLILHFDTSLLPPPFPIRFSLCRAPEAFCSSQFCSVQH